MRSLAGVIEPVSCSKWHSRLAVDGLLSPGLPLADLRAYSHYSCRRRSPLLVIRFTDLSATSGARPAIFDIGDPTLATYHDCLHSRLYGVGSGLQYHLLIESSPKHLNAVDSESDSGCHSWRQPTNPDSILFLQSRTVHAIERGVRGICRNPSSII